MADHIAEVVACYKLARHLLASIAQASRALDAYVAAVEVGLPPVPLGESVRYTHVGIEVKALPFGRVYDSRSRQPVKAVDHQYGLGGLGRVPGRQRLGGETLAAGIDGCHLEVVLPAWLYVYHVRWARGHGAVVKVLPALSRIYYIRGGHGCGFARVGLGLPGQLHPSGCHHLQAEAPGRKWLNRVARAMLGRHIF